MHAGALACRGAGSSSASLSLGVRAGRVWAVLRRHCGPPTCALRAHHAGEASPAQVGGNRLSLRGRQTEVDEVLRGSPRVAEAALRALHAARAAAAWPPPPPPPPPPPLPLALSGAGWSAAAAAAPMASGLPPPTPALGIHGWAAAGSVHSGPPAGNPPSGGFGAPPPPPPPPPPPLLEPLLLQLAREPTWVLIGSEVRRVVVGAWLG